MCGAEELGTWTFALNRGKLISDPDVSTPAIRGSGTDPFVQGKHSPSTNSVHYERPNSSILRLRAYLEVLSKPITKSNSNDRNSSRGSMLMRGASSQLQPLRTLFCSQQVKTSAKQFATALSCNPG